MPMVSVIMSAYNCGNIIYKAIESILMQTFSDFEFIICDDGSSDNTFSKLLCFAEKDNRIRVIRNKTNMGLTESLNKCIDIATGEFVARQDADDYSDSSRLKKQVEFLINNIQYDFVSSNIYLFDNQGVWGIRKLIKFPQKSDFLKGNPFVHPATVFRKSAILKASYYRVAKETRRVEDFDLFARMYAIGLRGCNLQEPLFYYSEDKESYRKRKYRYRINEAIIRYKAYKELKLYPIGILFVLKPLVVGLIPPSIALKIRKIVNKV